MKTQRLFLGFLGVLVFFLIQSCNTKGDPVGSYYYFSSYYKPTDIIVENVASESAYQLGFYINDYKIRFKYPKKRDQFLQLASYYGEKGKKQLFSSEPFCSKPYGFVSIQVYTPEPEHKDISQHYELYYSDYSAYIASNYQGRDPRYSMYGFPKEGFHNLAQLTPHDLKWLCDPCYLKKLETAPKGDVVLEVAIEDQGKIKKVLTELKEP